MKKLILILFVLLLQGCQATVDPATETTLRKKTEIIIQQMNQEEYEAVMQSAAKLFQQKVTVETLKQSWNSIPDVYGNYLGIDKVSIHTLNDIYQVQIIVNYENYKAQYTLAFDSHYQLIGIFFK